jgi:hypothetical protein
MPCNVCTQLWTAMFVFRSDVTLIGVWKVYWPPLWSSSHSSWLQIQRSEFDSRCYQIFWEVLGLERGPLSLVSTNEELLERKSSGTLYPQTLTLTSPISGGRSIGIVRSRTQTLEFVIFTVIYLNTVLSLSHTHTHTHTGTRDSVTVKALCRSVAVKALCRKPEGCGFGINWGK